jgi:SpoVK/Ycf46/Vps4 family AAA+-type ATPase
MGANFIEASKETFGSEYKDKAEKQLSALFTVAKANQPTVIFMDEADEFLADGDERTK